MGISYPVDPFPGFKEGFYAAAQRRSEDRKKPQALRGGAAA